MDNGLGTGISIIFNTYMLIERLIYHLLTVLTESGAWLYLFYKLLYAE